MMRLTNPSSLMLLSDYGLTLKQLRYLMDTPDDVDETVIPIVTDFGDISPEKLHALGMQAGMVFGALDTHPESWSTYAYPELERQLDLIAMEAGYKMQVWPCPVDDELKMFAFTISTGEDNG